MIRNIWHISDTHTYHGLLKVPSDVDMIIFSGDCSNPRDKWFNEVEVRSFLSWFAKLPIRHKIFVAGNHDSSIEASLVKKADFASVGIIYLENDFVVIEDIKIFGSPFTPKFGDWSFMKNRSKLNGIWERIPDDTDILIVHGPPKGVLDLSEDRDRNLEQCGCSALKKRVLNLRLKLMCFGHIHNFKDITNSGTARIASLNTLFSNGSVVTDNRFGELTSNGNMIMLVRDSAIHM